MWQEKVQALIDSKAGIRVNGKIASRKTVTHSRDVLMNAMNTLHELGYRVEDPKNIGERHIEALVRHWYLKTEAKNATGLHVEVTDCDGELAG